MSLILDAINKSEQQRPQAEPVPGVGTMHDAGAAAEPPPWRRLLWPVITTVLALLVIMLWLDGRAPAPVEEAPPLVQAVSPALPEPVLPEPVLPEPVTVPSMPAPEPMAEKVTPSPVSPATESPPGVGGTDVAALYAPAVTVEEDVTVTVDSGVAEMDVEFMALAAQKVLDEQAAEPVEVVHAAPLISELKQRTKDEIPSIFFSSHHWSSIPAERVVTLNGEARREGAQIKPGLRLVEILEDSIVLDYRGTEFRLNALNSWVNL
jgi:hypothetical protein